MAPPKWTVFDGLEEKEEDDKKQDKQEGSAGDTAGGQEDYGTSEADGPEVENTGGSAGEEAGGDVPQKDEGEDLKEGDGDKPDKKELLICAGAMCTCTQAVSPAPVKLNVVAQQRYSINDPDGSQKLLATDKEQDITALNFVSCKFPDPSKPRPCNPKLIWKDFYSPVVLPGGAHPLTERSTAFCTVGTGTVEVKMTGQQSAVTPAEVAAAGSAQWQSENPVLDESAADVQLEEDEEEGDQKGVGVVTIRPKTAGPYPVGVTIIFEAVKLTKPQAQCTAAELRGINWMVYDAKAMPCGHAVDGGVETAITFKKAGRFTVEGYGGAPGANNASAKTRKGSAIAAITIEENRLAGIKRVSGLGEKEYRFGEPAVYELCTLFPVAQVPLPGPQTLEAVVWKVVKKEGAGEPVLVPAGGSATVTCTGPCNYVVIATLGEKAEQSGLMKAIENRVIAVTAGVKSCRPGEEVVLKAVFKLEPATEAEKALLKWKCVDEKGGAHNEEFVAGAQEQRLKLKTAGTYKVYAFMHAPAKSVVAEFEVAQPQIKLIQWVYADKKTEKKITGWEEVSYLLMAFESAQDLEAEAVPGVVREGVFHPIMQPTRFKIKDNREDELHLKLNKAVFKEKVREGDFIGVQIRCVTPGQSIAGGEVRMLRFSEEEKLMGIAFFKGGERVTQVRYGDVLRCRVYCRNLSAGKAGIAVEINRLETVGGTYGVQGSSVMGLYRAEVGENGYGEFDFMLDGSRAGAYKAPIHKFWARIKEIDFGGTAQQAEVVASGKTGDLLFVVVSEPAESGKVSKVGVEKGEGNNNLSCGGKYCIKKGDKSELIREVNIRLCGFGGNVPTDEFTERTEKMIKQFQRDYMKVEETGRICGNVLEAIDQFQNDYIIPFQSIMCECGKCKGFGSGLSKEQMQDPNIAELHRKYEYPGIHRCLIWGLRAAWFYTEVIEKKLGFSIRNISSGYRCQYNNKTHKRNSTNHMGKALDVRFNKYGVRTQSVSDYEQLRAKIFVGKLGAQMRWKNSNVYSLEPGIANYKGEFIAPTWVHFDVRSFDLSFLKDKYFANNSSIAEGATMCSLASLMDLNICSCIEPTNSDRNAPKVISRDKNVKFTEADAKEAFRVIYNNYGKELTIVIEKMTRAETGHFASKQYQICGTGGMEVGEGKEAPYYGWNKEFFYIHPEYTPIGIWEAFENEGISKHGGNKQIKNKKKKFLMMPSVISALELKAYYINNYGGNYARWHSLNSETQENYRNSLKGVKPYFVNEFERNKAK